MKSVSLKSLVAVVALAASLAACTSATVGADRQVSPTALQWNK
ncbi:hypothetical protein [Telmatospirillum siberiense]|nr:hypothetical protein [Telmatospirillum siberiense]